MPHSTPPLTDLRVVDPTEPAVIDTVQAVTGGPAPYCRRCGAWDTVRPPALDGLLNHIPAHQCGIEVDVQPRTINGALAAPFV